MRFPVFRLRFPASFFLLTYYLIVVLSRLPHLYNEIKNFLTFPKMYPYSETGNKNLRI